MRPARSTWCNRAGIGRRNFLVAAVLNLGGGWPCGICGIGREHRQRLEFTADLRMTGQGRCDIHEGDGMPADQTTPGVRGSGEMPIACTRIWPQWGRRIGPLRVTQAEDAEQPAVGQIGHGSGMAVAGMCIARAWSRGRRRCHAWAGAGAGRGLPRSGVRAMSSSPAGSEEAIAIPHRARLAPAAAFTSYSSLSSAPPRPESNPRSGHRATFRRCPKSWAVTAAVKCGALPGRR